MCPHYHRVSEWNRGNWAVGSCSRWSPFTVATGLWEHMFCVSVNNLMTHMTHGWGIKIIMSPHMTPSMASVYLHQKHVKAEGTQLKSQCSDFNVPHSYCTCASSTCYLLCSSRNSELNEFIDAKWSQCVWEQNEPDWRQGHNDSAVAVLAANPNQSLWE